jgi:Leucine-rich repeat (LRR) protein
MAVQTLVNDGLSDSMCNQDPELFLERYALTLLNHSLLLESPYFGLHQCYGWGFPAVEIVCENDKVISLHLEFGIFCEACQRTIPTELSLLSHLGKYNLALYISTLEWRISFTNVVNLISLKYVEDLRMSQYHLRGQIPSQLGNLQSLTELYLSSNALTGQIPSQLGNIQSLTKLNLSFNALTRQIPSELGNLQSLTSVSFNFNELTGSIPTELGDLSKLSFCSIRESPSIF